MAATRFRWEDSVQSAFFRNPATSMLQLNTDFVARLDNADSWTLQSDFFDAYPGFEGDAPRYEIGPGGVRPSQRLLMRRMLEEAWMPKRKKKHVKKGKVGEWRDGVENSRVEGDPVVEVVGTLPL